MGASSPVNIIGPWKYVCTPGTRSHQWDGMRGLRLSCVRNPLKEEHVISLCFCIAKYVSLQ